MRRFLKATLLVCLAMASTHAKCDEVEDFYRGKQVTLLIGFPPGGGYDIYARSFAPYLAKHIPGHPNVTIQNMDGGVGVRAASYMFNVTAQNGTTLGMFLDGLSLSKILGGPGAYDPVKFNWIGRIVSTATFTAAWHKAPIASVQDAKLTPASMGATAVSSSSSYVPLALNDLIGTKFKVIRGYTGAAPIALALEAGEVDAHGGIALEVLQTSKREWITDKKIHLLYYLGAHSHPDYPNTPGLVDLAVDDKSRRVLNLLAGAQEIGRSLAAEPGAPPERVRALRAPFLKAVHDPEFVAEAKTRNLILESLSGEALQDVVASAASTPPELVELARKYLVQ